jgi:ribonucleoside-diphosphate reductase alpha chain
LTTVVVRATDTIETLKAKVEAATILGTMQSTLTKFPYLRNIWKRNTEEERLLGVSLTGSMDSALLNPLLNPTFAKVADILKKTAVETNKIWADKLGIEQSTAITCVKPEGTTSQLVDAASGLHARYAPYYIRRIRGDSKDPLVEFLKDAGVPHEKCVVKPENVTVFSFPIKSPDGAMIGRDLSSVDQLKVWREFQLGWCEHKPSVTISVKPDEWLDAAAFVWKNRHIVSGVSFLPFDGGVYKQAPYEEINKEQYEALAAAMPKTLNWDGMAAFEKEDATTAAQDLACVAGVCSIETIGSPLEGSPN